MKGELKTAGTMLACILSLPVCAFAAPLLITSNSTLIGATGVVVMGTSYDVQFRDGTFNALYPTGLTNVPFQANVGWANAASNALSMQVFTGVYDSLPQLTNGCNDTTECNVWTPYGVGNPTVLSMIFRNHSIPLELSDGVFGSNADRTTDFSAQGSRTYAVWSLSPVTQAPEPSSLLLAGLGLMVLFGRRYPR